MNRILPARGRLVRGRRALIPYQIAPASRAFRGSLPEGGVTRYVIA